MPGRQGQRVGGVQLPVPVGGIQDREIQGALAGGKAFPGRGIGGSQIDLHALQGDVEHQQPKCWTGHGVPLGSGQAREKDTLIAGLNVQHSGRVYGIATDDGLGVSRQSEKG